MPSRSSWSKRNFGAGVAARSRAIVFTVTPYCDPLRLQFSGNLRESVGTAGNEHQVVVIAGEELGQFVSDAAGGAGDQDCRHEDILANKKGAGESPAPT